MTKNPRDAKWLFAGESKFIAGAAEIAMIPKLAIPEVAFVGKSNVGKSSLINAITGRKTLARVSHTPGRTKQINFFSIRDMLLLVDLPGYGYAKISKAEHKQWNRLIYYYLSKRSNLKRVCLLIDSRRGLKDNDFEIINMFDEIGISYQIVLTKIDKISKVELQNVIENIKIVSEKHPAMHPEIMITSSNQQDTVERLKNELSNFAQI